MKEPQKPNDSKLVSVHINNLEPTLSNIVETIRYIILSTDNIVGERIKWNNPRFIIQVK